MGKTAIINYGMGNLYSVKKKLSRLNNQAIITFDPKEIESADRIILPGVGHFSRAMQNLRQLNLVETLNEQVLIKKKPLLGICLGMQLLAKSSEEGGSSGFGWIDAGVIRFRVKDAIKYKIPHTGWNQIRIMKESPLMKNIPDLSEFYFVHSFHLKPNNSRDILNETEYESTFVSAVEKENIFGVQYHPEKSHDAGILMFRNFLAI